MDSWDPEQGSCAIACPFQTMTSSAILAWPAPRVRQGALSRATSHSRQCSELSKEASVRPESREDEPLGCGLGRRRLNEQAQCFRLSKDHLYERSVMSDIQCLSCSKLDQEHGTTFGSCERCGHRSCRLHLVSASIRGSTDGYSVNVSASVDDPPRIKLFDPRLRAAIAEL